MLPHVGRIYADLKTRFQKRDRGNTSQSISQGGTVLSFLRRLFLSLEALPDDKQVWIPSATSAGLKIIVKERVEAIFTSGPPMSCHVIGLLLKAVTGRRWIADFRDPWLSHRENLLVTSTGVSKAIEAKLEKKTIRNADQVVLTTDRMQAELHQRYPDIRSKTTVIPNGYDPSDFHGPALAECRSVRERFTLTHAGTLYYRRTAEPFLVALSQLIESGQVPRSKVRVNFMGLSPEVRERSRQLGIDDVIRVVDAVNYSNCIEQLYCSDVLLLFAQGQPLQIPAKFYDYIAVRKPILVFTEDGATADLAHKLAGPIVVRPDDCERLQTHLRELYQQFERNTLSAVEWNNEGLRSEFTRLELTGKLVNLID